MSDEYYEEIKDILDILKSRYLGKKVTLDIGVIGPDNHVEYSGILEKITAQLFDNTCTDLTDVPKEDIKSVTLKFEKLKLSFDVQHLSLGKTIEGDYNLGNPDLDVYFRVQ